MRNLEEYSYALGWKAGCRGRGRCPYVGPSRETYAWQAGYRDGSAAANRLVNLPKPHQAEMRAGEALLDRLRAREIMEQALPVLDAVPDELNACWPGDCVHDSSCHVLDHRPVFRAQNSCSGVSYTFNGSWAAVADLFRLLIRETLPAAPGLRQSAIIEGHIGRYL